MPPEKLLNFLGEREFMSLIDKIDEFLKIDPSIDNIKDRKVARFLYKYFRERLSGPTLKNYAKQILDFLSDEEIDNLLNFVHQNFFDLREKLWQEESIETTEAEEIVEPMTFEEKEKKYVEIMKSIVQPEPIESNLEPEEKEFQTVTFELEPSKKEQEVLQIQDKSETQKPLPETTIIIKEKREEKPKESGDETLDLSKL